MILKLCIVRFPFFTTWTFDDIFRPDIPSLPFLAALRVSFLELLLKKQIKKAAKKDAEKKMLEMMSMELMS